MNSTNFKPGSLDGDSIDGSTLLAEPPKFTAKIVIFLVALLFVAILLWLSLSVVDVVTQASGQILPNDRVQHVQTDATRVVQDIYVAEGDEVTRGDVLIKFIDSSEGVALEHKQSRKSELYQNILMREAYIELLATDNKTISELDFPQKLSEFYRNYLAADFAAFQQQLASLQARLMEANLSLVAVSTGLDLINSRITNQKERIALLEPLVNSGLENRNNLLELNYQMIEMIKELGNKKAEVNQARAVVNTNRIELSKFISDKRASLYQELYSFTREHGQLAEELELNMLDYERTIVRSPMDGIVADLLVHVRGQVVQPAEVMLSVVPASGELELEAKVLNQDIGFIRIGQDVQVKLDSFNFTKYGSIGGIVTHIESASVADEQYGDIYPITVQLTSSHIVLGEESFALKPGMTATVAINTNKRRLIEYIFAPFFRWKFEAMRER